MSWLALWFSPAALGHCHYCYYYSVFQSCDSWSDWHASVVLFCRPELKSLWLTIFNSKAVYTRPVRNNGPTQVTNDCRNWKDTDVSSCCQQVNSVPDAVVTACRLSVVLILVPPHRDGKLWMKNLQRRISSGRCRFLNFITQDGTTTFTYKD